MKRILTGILVSSSLIALAQTAPKAVLLRLQDEQTIVLGSLEGNKWATADTLSSASQNAVKNGLKTVMFDLSGRLGKAMAGGKLEVGACDWNRVTDISTPVKLPELAYAIDAAWNPVPRVSKVLPNSSAAYVKVVADELKIRKITQAPVLTQVIQTDLDNDKVNEIILVAQTSKPSKSDTGDYSLVLVRKVIAGKVKTFVLSDYLIKKGYDAATDTGAQQGQSNIISAIADIDGDGKMEIFVDDQVHEGIGVTIFAWNGKNFGKTLEWGCGS